MNANRSTATSPALRAGVWLLLRARRDQKRQPRTRTCCGDEGEATAHVYWQPASEVVSTRPVRLVGQRQLQIELVCQIDRLARPVGDKQQRLAAFTELERGVDLAFSSVPVLAVLA
jgi:hypothetical protein